ncbi:MAG TPA: universal stress protein [Beutenbergiaceae bacterium]|nr:universal stress protein [Beutenbergiaceae bacterium]
MSDDGKQIVVGYDGSGESKAAIHWAAAVAQRRGRPLLVASAAGIDPGSQQVNTARRLSEEGAALAKKHADITVSAESPGAGAVATLVGLSKEAELVVMGNRGRGRLRGALLGSAAFSVAIHAECPVAITRDTIRPLPSSEYPIVVGSDGSPASSAAVEEAGRLASQTGANLKIVVAYDAPSNAPWLIAHYPEEVKGGSEQNVWTRQVFDPDLDGTSGEQRQREAAGIAHEAADRVAQRYPEVPIDLVVISGRPERAIVDAADEASLIVVGARGRGDFASLLLGSVSRDVIQHADCTVYVVR